MVSFFFWFWLGLWTYLLDRADSNKWKINYPMFWRAWLEMKRRMNEWRGRMLHVLQVVFLCSRGYSSKTDFGYKPLSNPWATLLIAGFVKSSAFVSSYFCFTDREGWKEKSSGMLWIPKGLAPQESLYVCSLFDWYFVCYLCPGCEKRTAPVSLVTWRGTD